MSSPVAALRLSSLAVAVNIALSILKIAVGVVGNSYALIADGIESSADVLSSFVVWSGLRISLRPADANHPFGHGKAESISGLVVAVALFGAGLLIATSCIREIFQPHHAPAWFTLPVLAVIIVAKELLYRRVLRAGLELDSNALKGDAWHHRSDAITSSAAFIGIAIALLGGPGYESADSWGALVACSVIFYNSYHLIGPSLNEVMDAAVPGEIEAKIRAIAENVEGVRGTEKCRVRKSGLGLYMDIHIIVDGQVTVQLGHEIGHRVQKRLYESDLRITDAIVHIEPDTPRSARS